jgi:hypothetical protein
VVDRLGSESSDQSIVIDSNLLAINNGPLDVPRIDYFFWLLEEERAGDKLDWRPPTDKGNCTQPSIHVPICSACPVEMDAFSMGLIKR